jgi:predicted TIM-barrel fold metal-dependent hydrolase
MIIDSHAHIFEKWSGACGLPSREIHWRFIQKNLTRPAAKVFRYRDGAPADASPLYRKGDNSWAGLRDDVAFRVGPYGRIEFTVDGEDYYVQYMPVAMAQIESTPEFMITQMNAAGVDHCVLQAGFAYGYMNDYNALAQRQFPHRFTGLFHVEEPQADSEQWISEARRAVEQLGLRGIYYQLDGFARYGFSTWFDDARYDRFWDLIQSYDVPVFFETSAIPDYDKASYLGIMGRLGRLMGRFPRLRWLMVMTPPVQYFPRDGRWDFPEQAAAVYGRENVRLEMCYPISWGGVWDYPFPEARALIRGLRDRYGADKLVWGSDMPNVERFCTYKQSLDYLRRYGDFLSADEMDKVLGDNVRELVGITASAEN